MQPWLVAFARCSMMVAVWSVALSTLAGQAPGPNAGRGSAASGTSALSIRTPWGAPDLQGTWTSEPEFGVPFESPAEFAGRELLTDQEYAKRVAQSERQAAEALNEIDVFTIDTSNAGGVCCRTPA